MPYRNFGVGEFYHCYNRGTDKRVIFSDQSDYAYFLKSLTYLKLNKSLTSLCLYDDEIFDDPEVEPIVAIVAYCLLPNHFHVLLREVTEGGISKFMQKLCTGYTMYFNQKYQRSGSLFQGAYKAKHIENDETLRHISAYINLNYKVHKITDQSTYRSSIDAYSNPEHKAAQTFGGQTSKCNRICSEYEFLIDDPRAYLQFAEESVAETIGIRTSQEKPKPGNYLEV